MKKGPAPCIDCPKKGCGAYHDICPDYQEWVNDEVDETELYREYIPQNTWNSRKKYRKGR